MSTDSRDDPKTPKLKITDWVIRAAVAFVFVSSGLEKFGIGGGQEWVGMFARIGFGDWFRYLTGVLEIAGGVLLMIPIASTAGVVLLVACMVGAILAHIFKLGDPFSSIINSLLIVAIVFAGRKPRADAEDIASLELNTLTTEDTENTE